MYNIFIDIETNSLSKLAFFTEYNSTQWPKPIQICCLVTNLDLNIIHVYYVNIIASKIPSIIFGYNSSCAINPRLAATQLISLFKSYQPFQLIAHNILFDKGVLKSFLYNELKVNIKLSNTFCTLQKSKKIFNVGSLETIYNILYPKSFLPHHNALFDCIKCYKLYKLLPI